MQSQGINSILVSLLQRRLVYRSPPATHPPPGARRARDPGSSWLWPHQNRRLRCALAVKLAAIALAATLGSPHLRRQRCDARRAARRRPPWPAPARQYRVGGVGLCGAGCDARQLAVAPPTLNVLRLVPPPPPWMEASRRAADDPISNSSEIAFTNSGK